MEHQNNNFHDGERPVSISDYTASHSSGDGSDSTPHTPPSPMVVPVPVPNQLPMLEPQITLTPTTSPKKSSRSPKRGGTPKSRLGAIDEDTDLMSPDLPLRNPRRILRPPSRLFSLAFPPTLYNSRSSPKKIWDDVEGPNGEKFSDLRNNKKSSTAGGGRRKRFIWLGLVILAIGLIVMIVLLAVLLTRNKRNNNNNNNQSNDSGSGIENNATSASFPAGTYSIESYLTSTSTNCTSNAATWRCYPYQTYSEVASNSLTTISWTIDASASNSNSNNYVISSKDTLFSYPFSSVPLTLRDQGTDNEAYTFIYTYTKSVFPDANLGTNNVRTRCYFNNTLLTGKLYTRMQKSAMLSTTNNKNNSSNTTTTTGNSNGNQWPYALEFSESIASGNDVPTCYEYVNGVNGARVDIPSVTVGGAQSLCQCKYANYGV